MYDISIHDANGELKSISIAGSPRKESDGRTIIDFYAIDASKNELIKRMDLEFKVYNRYAAMSDLGVLISQIET